MQQKNQSPANDFAFTAANLAVAKAAIAKYPDGRAPSAVLALLDLAQRQEWAETGRAWVRPAAITTIATMLDMAPLRVEEVASFFTMINLKPVGRYHIQLCGTTPCMLSGSDHIMTAIKKFLHIEKGQTTADGLFTLSEVECLGACCNAPMVQINDDYYEDLTPLSIVTILQLLKNGETPRAGSQSGRRRSEPQAL
ncbi:MAG: NAD(P)H-dependent oxidoreductase subunit E [Alphaproteobacteria bacterium]|nr:NAD(P)H-dependent oxidoreductase subunit E [Alphaproteobacteria bacterium]